MPPDPREMQAALDAAYAALASLESAPEGIASAESPAALKAENERLRAALSRVAFRALVGGVRTPAQAAYILGLPGVWGLDDAVIQARFRLLTAVFHPDAGLLPDGERFRQVTEARAILLRHLQSE